MSILCDLRMHDVYPHWLWDCRRASRHESFWGALEYWSRPAFFVVWSLSLGTCWGRIRREVSDIFFGQRINARLSERRWVWLWRSEARGVMRWELFSDWLAVRHAGLNGLSRVLAATLLILQDLSETTSCISERSFWYSRKTLLGVWRKVPLGGTRTWSWSGNRHSSR